MCAGGHVCLLILTQLPVTGLSLDMTMRLNDVRIYDIVFVSVPASAVPDNNLHDAEMLGHQGSKVHQTIIIGKVQQTGWMRVVS